jgi:glycosyltransferase involved in cell wall biosynthesis
MLAPLPPPITGAAGNNKRIADTLCKSDAVVVNINTAAPGLSRSAGLRYHARRITCNIAAAGKLLATHGPDATLYVQPDAGLGAWYTLVQVLIAKRQFSKFVFHHRSFAYVSASLTPMQRIVAATRAEALHVFLSDEMARQFIARYGPVRSLVVTNACFVSQEASVAATLSGHHTDITIGHLSNLRKNKGFFEVADVFEQLAQTGKPVRLFLAGPITEPQVAPRLNQLKQHWGDRVRHFGLITGDEKAAFYRALDLFLFPTTHPQEAQPNVIFEALAAGVPVLATPRAAIPEMLSGANGACSPTEASFTAFAVSCISSMSFASQVTAERRKTIRDWVRNEALRSQRAFMELMCELGIAEFKVVPPWN